MEIKVFHMPPEPVKLAESVSEKARAIMGRPTIYNDDVANAICFLVATTLKPLKKICDEVGINYQTLFTWKNNNKEFSDLYARAKEAQQELMAEDIIDIVDTPIKDRDMAEASRMKLQVEARKWLMSKYAQKKFGDKAIVEHEHKHTVVATEEQLAQLMSQVEEVSLPLVKEADNDDEYLDYTTTE